MRFLHSVSKVLIYFQTRVMSQAVVQSDTVVRVHSNVATQIVHRQQQFVTELTIAVMEGKLSKQ